MAAATQLQFTDYSNEKFAYIHLPSMQRMAFLHDPTIASSPIKKIPDDLLLACLARVTRDSIAPASGVCQKWRRIIHSVEFLERRSDLNILQPCLAVLSADAKFYQSGKPVQVQLFQPPKSSPMQQLPLDQAEQVPEAEEEMEPIRDNPRGIWNACTFVTASCMTVDDFSTCISSNHGIFLFGGVLGNGKCNPPLFYDTWTNHAIDLPRMEDPRTRFVGGTINGSVYVAGGLRNKFQMVTLEGEVSEAPQGPVATGQTSPSGRTRLFPRLMPRKSVMRVQTCEARDLKSCEVYHSGSSGWMQLAEMSVARVGAFGGFVNGKLYVIGGTSRSHEDNIRASRSLEVYDPETDSWTLKEPIQALGYVLSSAIIGQWIFLMRQDRDTVSWLRYDTETEEWKGMHSVPVPPDHRRTHLTKFDCVAVGQKIYLVQVWGTKKDLTNQQEDRGAFVLEYDPSLEGAAAWKEMLEMPQATRGAVCASVCC